METKQALTEARKLIKNKKNWTKGAFARDALDQPVSPFSPNAVCFCGVGALYRVTGCSTFAAPPGYHEICRAARRTNFAGFNDANKRTHAEVLAAFARAIKAAA